MNHEDFMKKALALAEEAEKERIKYQQAEEEYRNEYAELLAQCVAEFHTACQSMELEQDRLQRSLNDQRSITKSAIEANRRANEIAEQANFYKLNIPEADLEEIEKLRETIDNNTKAMMKLCNKLGVDYEQ